MALLRTIAYGFVLSIIFGTAVFLCLMFLPEGVAEILYGIIRWPISVVPGMLLGFVIAFFRWTTVEIEGEQIRISRAGHQETYLLGQYVNTSIIKKLGSVLIRNTRQYNAVLYLTSRGESGKCGCTGLEKGSWRSCWTLCGMQEYGG